MVRDNSPLVKWTATQRDEQWKQCAALELHHEVALPAQRYASRDQQPPRRNPITPNGDAPFAPPTPPMDSAAIAKEFNALNALHARKTMTGNPIFGFSNHSPPMPIGDELRLSQNTMPAASHSRPKVTAAASRQRMHELQAEIEAERAMRREIEHKLNRKAM
uniref:Uncharacterized protein n=1 Tax=Chrysotila carterae TaxID=13221 RepID=A0A7S4EUJ0_CHRCT|mmetsp:Transcript_14179/g.29940  ORF Transcript_14179/g.29940 Transcript_14179/m.29940 type:complete len:162 (-) Transcript_14179:721-1206(-)